MAIVRHGIQCWLSANTKDFFRRAFLCILVQSNRLNFVKSQHDIIDSFSTKIEDFYQNKLTYKEILYEIQIFLWKCESKNPSLSQEKGWKEKVLEVLAKTPGKALSAMNYGVNLSDSKKKVSCGKDLGKKVQKAAAKKEREESSAPSESSYEYLIGFYLPKHIWDNIFISYLGPLGFFELFSSPEKIHSVKPSQSGAVGFNLSGFSAMFVNLDLYSKKQIMQILETK